MGFFETVVLFPYRQTSRPNPRGDVCIPKVVALPLPKQFLGNPAEITPCIVHVATSGRYMYSVPGPFLSSSILLAKTRTNVFIRNDGGRPGSGSIQYPV